MGGTAGGDAPRWRFPKEVLLTIDRPADWVGPFTVVTKIDEGWNDGVDPSQAVETPPQIDAYLGKRRHLEFWLLDESADLVHPIQLLGTIDLSGFGSVVDAKGGGVVRVLLGGRFRVSTTEGVPVVEPTVTIVDAAS